MPLQPSDFFPKLKPYLTQEEWEKKRKADEETEARNAAAIMSEGKKMVLIRERILRIAAEKAAGTYKPDEPVEDNNQA